MNLDPPVAITTGAFGIVLSVGAWEPKIGSAILTSWFVALGLILIISGIRKMLQSRAEIRNSRRGFEVIFAAPPDK